ASALNNLIIGQTDLLQPAVLEITKFNETYGSRLGPAPLGICEVRWRGPLVVQNIGAYCASVRVQVMENAEDAMKLHESRQVLASVFDEDFTGKAPYASFADRAWTFGYQTDLSFIRGNVLCEVSYQSIMDMPQFPHHISFDEARKQEHEGMLVVAKNLSRRIDAALAGNPEPATILPLSWNEMGGYLDRVWEAEKLSGPTWKGKCGKILLQVEGSPIRELPAIPMKDGDYMVPARGLFMMLDSKTSDDFNRMDVTGEASVDLMGVRTVFQDGKSEVQRGDQAFKLKHPVAIRGGVVLVPISFADDVLGFHMKWSKLDKKPFAQTTVPPSK
ncbi:MAG TPA: stalk domain-containing protein, partial [Armatimonadota bacterium]